MVKLEAEHECRNAVIDGIHPPREKFRKLWIKSWFKREYSQDKNNNSFAVLRLLQNLLLVSWGGAPAFWKEEAASWSMGAEPG